ncbi:hypothetical protein DMC30DRAFT_220258 [Rhodotorula diobovata]|uniref:Uncharacterized protein n=1 Tax=Rhodotorula diobovata TaxID=5288 RepID=A0A5C5FYD5_9BASI|nr:hypothetical protein DMC30DRAFT_220258 [Rhodotorula diobovata]
MPVVYPDEFPTRSAPSAYPWESPAVVSATQRGMRQAGIAPGATPFSHKEVHQVKMARLMIDRTGRGSDGALHHQHLDANATGVHDDIKDLFNTLEGKVAQVEHKRNRKTGGLTYRDQRLPEPTPSSSLSLTPAVLRSTPAMSGLGAGGDGNGGASDSDDEPCAFPHARGLTQPRTADELAHVLAQLKPGKKILKVAGEIDITETFVTEVVVQRDTPARKPVLVVMCGNGLPSQRTIQASPRLMGMWRIGSRSPQKQVLILRCTKTVHIEVHFQLQVAI